ncbi:glycoside hydrolase [Beggiatoa alba]|nr:glycoside hydrolase [Beggiatoa alba]
MSDKIALKVVLYWHMHQPEYRDLRTGQYFLPWTYLHVIKDYVDMAAHLEANPQAKAVVNFTPTLLEQIDDYAIQVEAYLKQGSAFREPMLEALISPIVPNTQEKRLTLIRQCLRANEERLINRYPEYLRLAELAKCLEGRPESIFYIDDQYFNDIIVWFHLAWLGETVRRNDSQIKRLLKKGSAYTLHDRIELLKIIGHLITHIIQRYRKLAESGQVELSMTPYGHPIIPLLLDVQSACEAMPEVELPALSHYPGGETRARWHIEKGLQTFEHYFGFKPAGCWPSEGSISEATIALLSEFDFKWLASGETVLRSSLEKSKAHESEALNCIHRAYRYLATSPICFFRDDGLSDQIGFNYSDWHADDAVANLVHHLENIAGACQSRDDAIISIILDGENAWEFYPENGYYFLDTLYKTLSDHPDIELTTYSSYLAQQYEAHELKHIVAGSWVYGTFSTWIGDTDKNHAWDMLGHAKNVYDQQIKKQSFDVQKKQRIDQQLAICEGSDWFWWFGDYNPSESVNDFDYLYRLQLANLYVLLGQEPPSYLSDAFSHGSSGAPAMSGTMRHGKEPN